MIVATLLLCAPQQALSVNDILALPWEGNEQFVYSQVLDATVDSDRRAALAEYAVIFEGHSALEVFDELLVPETTPSLLHALLREWGGCIEPNDRQLLLSIAQQSHSRTAFLALRNLVLLCKTASDYIPLVDLAAQRDVALAQRFLTYLPRLPDDGSFRDYLGSQLSSSHDSYRAAMLNKVVEYHTPESFLELYTQRVSSNDFPQQAEWMPFIARQDSVECQQAAAHWLLSSNNPQFISAAVAVARALSNSDVLDGDEELYMQHPLLTHQQVSSLLVSRIAKSDESANFAVDHFADFPAAWQKMILNAFGFNPTLATLRLTDTVAFFVRHQEDVRAAAIRSLVKQHAPAQPMTVITLLNDEWSSYEVAEALIEFAVQTNIAAPKELLLMIDGQQQLADLTDELRRVVYRSCADRSGESSAAFIIEHWALELLRLQQNANDVAPLTDISSLAEVARVSNNFNQLVDAVVAHSPVNEDKFLSSLFPLRVNNNGAVLLIYTAARISKSNAQVARQLLEKAARSLDERHESWQLRAWCLAAQLEDNDVFAFEALEKLLLTPDRVNKYEFAVREGFAPQGAGWHDLTRAIAHRQLYLDSVIKHQPQSLRPLLSGQVEAELLLEAAQFCIAVPHNQPNRSLVMGVALAQRAVDLSPYSIPAHQQLVACNLAALVEHETGKIAAARLRRLRTNPTK